MAKRTRTTGCVLERPKGSGNWYIKFDEPRKPGEKRKSRMMAVPNAKSRGDAQDELVRQRNAMLERRYVSPDKTTVGGYAIARVQYWRDSEAISQRTFERYDELARWQIAARPIGTKTLQALAKSDVTDWHIDLRKNGRRQGVGGLSPMTVLHAHRVLSKAMDDAVEDGILPFNVLTTGRKRTPRAKSKPMVILSPEQVVDVVAKMKGRPQNALVVTALFTGMRLGELLALRWRNVDLERAVIHVVEAVDTTKARKGTGFKDPKTERGTRSISLPGVVVEALRTYRREQLETRLALGYGKMPEDALVFPNEAGKARSVPVVSKEWARMAKGMGVPDVTFHGLRHTHASQLIDANVDIVTISRRFGHANPATTLKIYAHLFKQTDEKAARAIDAALESPAAGG